MPSDLYRILNVRRDATPRQIHAAYIKLARQYHPDLNLRDPTAKEHFKQIRWAYEVLSNPSAKTDYDCGVSSRPASVHPPGAGAGTGAGTTTWPYRSHPEGDQGAPFRVRVPPARHGDRVAWWVLAAACLCVLCMIYLAVLDSHQRRITAERGLAGRMVAAPREDPPPQPPEPVAAQSDEVAPRREAVEDRTGARSPEAVARTRLASEPWPDQRLAANPMPCGLGLDPDTWQVSDADSGPAPLMRATVVAPWADKLPLITADTALEMARYWREMPGPALVPLPIAEPLSRLALDLDSLEPPLVVSDPQQVAEANQAGVSQVSADAPLPTREVGSGPLEQWWPTLSATNQRGTISPRSATDFRLSELWFSVASPRAGRSAVQVDPQGNEWSPFDVTTNAARSVDQNGGPARYPGGSIRFPWEPSRPAPASKTDNTWSAPYGSVPGLF
jgi:molecular chaperone DnaJ